jgi:hypothetical protein
MIRHPMARWAALVGGVALVTAIALVPRGVARDEYRWEEAAWVDHPEVLQALRASRAANLRFDALRREWIRVESRALATESRDARGLIVTTGAGIRPENRGRFEQFAQSELAGLGLREPRHPIAVRVELDTSREAGSFYDRVTVLPATATDPCVVIIRANSSPSRRMRLHAEDRLLGTCAFFAAFGTPGAATARWLVDTRGLSAEYLQPPPGIAADTGRINTTSYWRDRPISLRACRAGILAACAQLVQPTAARADWDAFGRRPWEESVTGSRSADFPEVMVRWPGAFVQPMMPVTGGLMAQLAAELGAERFEALWRSEAGLAAEFERRQGRTLEEWTRDYVLSRTAPYDPGPGIPALPAALGIAIVLGLAALTLLRARRVMS